MTSSMARNEAGSAATEFALLAPTFLMFLFLLLDGGRMVFAKQSLNDLANVTARCAASKATGCDTIANAQSWAVSRGLARNNLQLSTSNVTINSPAPNTACGGVANMTQATISMTWKRGAMTLLPQSVAPSTLSASACFATTPS